ncbi:unnamed protein product [Psylliodes chrysocephalus]|uniref:Uncharacterized protein n=1 Tax=Psylliodes chrysocephalus TaxID=3402493 RepID=A0A9P0CFE6_9CUCU|nr:unnamed protein product [Psylliodes chrysocephala]
MQLQGSGNNQLENVANIFIFEDKLRTFICKLQLWLRKIEENNYSAFATLKALVEVKKYDATKANIQENNKTHLQMLNAEFYRYWPEYTQEAKVDQKLIRNPFNRDAGEVTEGIQEGHIEFQNDRNYKDTFKLNSLESFWCKKAISYTKLREIAFYDFLNNIFM